MLRWPFPDSDGGLEGAVLGGDKTHFRAAVFEVALKRPHIRSWL
jgi:hypothetical protein